MNGPKIVCLGKIDVSYLAAEKCSADPEPRTFALVSKLSKLDVEVGTNQEIQILYLL